MRKTLKDANLESMAGKCVPPRRPSASSRLVADEPGFPLSLYASLKYSCRMTGPLQYIDLSQPSLWIAVGSILFVCLLLRLSDDSRRCGTCLSMQGAAGSDLLLF